MANKPLNIAFYSPYLTDHLGGGEKHVLDIATVCAQAGHHVSICVPATQTAGKLDSLQKRLSAAFDVNTSLFSWIVSPLFQQSFSWQKLQWTKQFDYLYYVTDGSLFFSLAKHNILHVQIPFKHQLHGVLDRLKLRNWQTIQTNSAFTKKVIEKSWGCKVEHVVYPVVDESLFDIREKKQDVILSVGRFFRQLHSKRQDILVKSFAALRLRTKESSSWRLVLLGSVEDEEYFQEVRKLAHGLPVTFVTNATRSDVLNWYGMAKLYWHAAGFAQNEEQHPERVEHFGISTVEAMAAGAVPLVVGKGGQKEILSDALSELQWQSVDDLVSKSSILMRSEEYYKNFQTQTKRRARDFDRRRFVGAVTELFGIREAV